MKTEITWHTTDLSLTRVEKMLGADHVAMLRRQEHPAASCDCRATGAWDANDREAHAAYRSLAVLFRTGRAQ